MGYQNFKEWKCAQVIMDRCHQNDPWTFVLILLSFSGGGDGSGWFVVGLKEHKNFVLK